MAGKSERLAKIRAYATYKFKKVIYVGGVETGIKKRVYAARWYGCYGDLLWATDIYLEGKERVPEGRAVDIRTLAATQDGCCPPVLEEGFLGGESEREFEEKRRTVIF